jgi:hypothetical protein
MLDWKTEYIYYLKSELVPDIVLDRSYQHMGATLMTANPTIAVNVSFDRILKRVDCPNSFNLLKCFN